MDMAPPSVADHPPPHPFQLVLRLVVFAAAVAAVGSARAAPGQPEFVLEATVVGLALVAALRPDSHVGLLVVASIGLDWVVAVDDRTSAWVLGAAASTALFHVAMSAASVAPAPARWTPAMRRRWARGSAAQVVVVVPTWLMVVVVAEAEIGGSALVLASALATIGVGVVWATRGEASTPPARRDGRRTLTGPSPFPHNRGRT